jgi:predicted CDP-diglyceride synthetase/phosphatidate cytidylyltransferase
MRRNEAILGEKKNLQSKKQIVTTGIMKKAMISAIRIHLNIRYLVATVTIGPFKKKLPKKEWGPVIPHHGGLQKIQDSVVCFTWLHGEKLQLINTLM